MRGVIFFLDLLLFLFLFGELFDYLIIGEYSKPKGLGKLACDVAFVVEGKRDLSKKDIEFILKFIPREAYFEINSTRIYYIRNNSYVNLFSCKIENTTVKIGI